LGEREAQTGCLLQASRRKIEKVFREITSLFSHYADMVLLPEAGVLEHIYGGKTYT
jgi:hypothetical protein